MTLFYSFYRTIGLFLTNILPKNLSLQKFFKKNLQNKKNKNINNYYKLNGAIYICKIKKLFEKNTLFLEKNIYAFKMSQKTSIDVDTEFDFKRASNLIKQKKICWKKNLIR